MRNARAGIFFKAVVTMYHGSRTRYPAIPTDHPLAYTTKLVYPKLKLAPLIALIGTILPLLIFFSCFNI
jgi:hypothetical protein